MSNGEEVTQSLAAYKQAMYCREIKPVDIPVNTCCYHGNLLLECTSYNCQVDSYRIAKPTPPRIVYASHRDTKE